MKIALQQLGARHIIFSPTNGKIPPSTLNQVIIKKAYKRAKTTTKPCELRRQLNSAEVFKRKQKDIYNRFHAILRMAGIGNSDLMNMPMPEVRERLMKALREQEQ